MLGQLLFRPGPKLLRFAEHACVAQGINPSQDLSQGIKTCRCHTLLPGFFQHHIFHCKPLQMHYRLVGRKWQTRDTGGKILAMSKVRWLWVAFGGPQSIIQSTEQQHEQIYKCHSMQTQPVACMYIQWATNTSGLNLHVLTHTCAFV